MMDSKLNAMPNLFSALHKKMMENHQQLLSHYGLSKIHLPYLMILSAHEDGLTQKEMVDQLFLDKGHASRALRDLVDKHMINKDDQTTYKNKYFTNENGLKVVQAVRKQTMDLRKKVIESLTEEELVLFTKVIEKMIEVLE